MKKIILMSALLLLMGITVDAQEDFSKSTTTTTIVENADKYKVETNRFWSNWFVSVGGGHRCISVTIMCRWRLATGLVLLWILLLENGSRRVSVCGLCIVDCLSKGPLKTEVTLQAKSMMPLNGSTNRNSTL